VRTRFSDDRLWLVYGVLQYISATGDAALLDEEIPFLEGRVLAPGEQELYERPSVSPVGASLYEHCVRALALNLSNGSHGLPLMGTGDWNDGMNQVGSEGRGESVWLGWFLSSILRPFALLASARGEEDRAVQYRKHADALTEALAAAWDGAWYRRAYFDDETPLGSQINTECRIDSIAQSWAVIAGGGALARARQAMESVDELLIRRDDKLVLLLTPPFDRMQPSPGYIQGYVPGVRENGGQYTHAALWTVLAFAKLGDGDRAMELFTMLNPINHARTPEEVARYRTEPYAVAGDVYSSVPHTGRGGWTWYTGAAGWMYRVGIESLLGLSLKGGALHIDPCIPRDWEGYEAILKTPQAEFHITVENPDGVNQGVRSLEVDGMASGLRVVSLTDALGTHAVRVVLGR
jgi:cyclic beta-1,2-glucan synthetase